jgi:hypothetical protein
MIHSGTNKKQAYYQNESRAALLFAQATRRSRGPGCRLPKAAREETSSQEEVMTGRALRDLEIQDIY